ncbi:intermembrane lipid transfer protein Vps13 [Condylostylus longicornis]|uniref:intermembrane lipid transfer protein Vps13 n=1 Tax=Condylostylus longicornis TaxID=2530218 RepID=UPI00244DB28B|nr:intermembrane lipid transfer protein Vps13 [Condylostylus longicornis]
MVFEAVVCDIVNKIVGDYIENLDSKQLKIGIWGGDVILHDLKLRENALDDLDLPVQLVYGHLGDFVLKIPWKNLYSQPVEARIENLYVLITPKQALRYNQEKEEKYELSAKKAVLAKIDEAKEYELEKEKAAKDKTFTEKLTAQIINNLQIKIANIHIRYEDANTTGKPFAFGITLRKLELYTTDADWVKTFLSEQVSKVFKVADLDSLAAYLNCNSKDMFSHNDISEYEKLFSETIAYQNHLPKYYKYVIGPISCLAKLKLNMNPELDTPAFEVAKVDLYLEMQKLNIKLNDAQFHDLLKLADAMNRMQLGLPYRKYRPYNKSYKGNYKEWWNFAITCILEETVNRKRRNWSWDHIKKHRKFCNEYKELLINKLMSKKPNNTANEMLDFYEKELDLFNLILIRNRVHLEVEKKRQEEQVKSNTKTSWFGGWFGYSSTQEKSSNEIVEKFQTAMTAEEKKKLYDAIGYHESQIDLIYPESYEAIQLKFKLIALEIGLFCEKECSLNKNNAQLENSLDDQSQELMMLEFSVVTCEISQRPAANALKVIAGMKDMKLIGLQRGDFVPELISSNLTDEFNLLNVHFEKNPIDKSCDQKLKIVAKSLRAIYDSDTILTLLQKFSPPKVNLSEFEEAAYEQMQRISERSALGLEYMVEKHDIVFVDVSFEPSIVLIPKDGVYYKNESSAIVLSLGKLTINSEPRTTDTTIAKMTGSGVDKATILQRIMDQAYDKYKLALNDIQILVVTPKENWKETLLESKFTAMHLLSPTSLFVNADICAIDDDPRLPKAKVEALLPNLCLYLYENRMMLALEIATSIPTPEEAKPEEPMPLKKAQSFLSTRSLTAFDKNRKAKAKPKPEKSVEESVVQYTTLQMGFSLQEFKVVLMKSEEENNDAETPPETYLTPVEDINITQEFDTFDQNQHKKLLELKILQLDTFFAKRTYEMIATIKLGAINLLQDDESLSEPLAIIDTPGFVKDREYLLTIDYTMADQRSPVFKTNYASTEQFIQIHFSILLVVLHQECLQKLLEISDNIQRKIKSKTEQFVPVNQDRFADADTRSISSTMSRIQKGGEVLKKSLTAAQQKNLKRITVVESIKMRVVADFKNLSVEITCSKRPIALLEIKNFFSDLILKSSYTEVSFGLKNILITDLNPHTIHKNILSIIGENVFKCQVVIYNLEETKNFNSDNMKIEVNIGCVKILFLYWFVNSVLTFLNNFQAAQNALAEASTSAADAAKQNVVEAYGQSKRIRMNVQVKAPIIIVPIDSKSLTGICLDLGYLRFTTHTMEARIGKDNTKAIIDEIKLDLSDLKLGNVVAKKDFAEVILNTGELCECQTVKSILEPVSFTICVKRNVTHMLFDDQPELDASGHLKSIHVTLHEEDYRLVMSILDKNLSEGLQEFETKSAVVASPPREKQIAVADIHSPAASPDAKEKSAKHKVGVIETIAEEVSEEKLTLIKDQLRFNFQFDGVIINFLDSNGGGLAEFGLHFLSIKGKRLTDGTLSTSIILCDIQLDDARPESKSKITRYLSRKETLSSDFENQNAQQLKSSKTHMLDVVAIITSEETFAEVKVSGFNLIISLEFLIRICDFFVIPEQTDPPVDVVITDQRNVYPGSTSNKIPVAKVEDPKPKGKLKFVLHVEEPDIILVESLDDMNTYAIIFNTQIELNYKMIENKQLVYAEIKELKMYMCAFKPERREGTTHYIIHPCSIVLQGSTPDEEGLHLSLKCSDIIINISPGTMELLNKAIAVTTMKSDKKNMNTATEQNLKNMWEIEQYSDQEFWFMKTEKAEDVLITDFENIQKRSMKNKEEQCVIEVPSIVIIFETGIGFFTTPMLFLDTKLEGCAYNWSSNIRINASMTLVVNYFNNSLAVWEPLIEPIEKFQKNGIQEYEPWQLDFSMEVGQSDEESEENTITKIQIKSVENLEITLSRTCYDLLLTLSEAFSEALDEKGLSKPQVISAYTVQNHTGFDITIKFPNSSIFTLNECYISNSSFDVNEGLQKQIIFQAQNEKSSNIQPEDILECIVSPGGKVYLQTKRHSMLEAGDESETMDLTIPEYNLIVQIGEIQKDLVLPVSKSDKRYFPLYRDMNQEPWGIVSEVKTEFGTTKINIHGVVGIQNHFKTSINISKSRDANDELSFIGNVGPNEIFFLPLYAIYPSSKELYISLPGYTYSVQGIKWNDKITEMGYKRQIQCDPITTFEPLYINVIREKSEIYHETTSMHTIASAFYLIHLRPPLYFRNFLPIQVKLSVSGCSVKSGFLDDVDSKSKLSVQKEDFLDYGEKSVDPGDVLQLPTVKLTGKVGETKSYIVLRLLQYLEKDWSCTTEIPQNYEEFETWTFSSYDSAAKMDLDLGVRFENRHGSLMVTLFSPFWLINKTGLLLTYKVQLDSINLLYHPPDYHLPILFSFKKKLFAKKSITIRVENGEWSEKIPLDIAGAAGDVKCELEGNTYKIGVHNHLTYNSLTKQITFIPYFVAINKCIDFSIEIQEHNRPADPWTTIGPDECIPFWPQGEASNRMVVRILGETQSSVPFPYDEGHHTLLKLDNSVFGAVNVDVQVTEGGTYITFKQYNVGDAPGLLINHTNSSIIYWEKKDVNRSSLDPNEKVLLTWGNPSGERIIVWQDGKHEIESDLRRDGVGKFKLNNSTTAYWVSFLDGLQRIILFTETEWIAEQAESNANLQKINQDIEFSLHGIGISIVNNISKVDITYLCIKSSGRIWQYQKSKSNRWKQLKIAQNELIETKYQEYLNEQRVGNEMKQYSLSEEQTDIVNFKEMTWSKTVKDIRKLKRTFYPGVWISMKSSPFQMQIHAKINRIQIDNQLTDCVFPVVLAPIPPPKTVAASIEFKPFIESSIVKRVIPNSNMNQFKYCTLLIQEFHIKVDLPFLTALSEMFTTDTTDQQAAKLFAEDVGSIQSPLSDLVASHSLAELKHFYDNLHLGPLKIHVSFSLAGAEPGALPGILSPIVQGVGVTLTDVNDVVFRLAYFQREYSFYTKQQLQSEITTHYVGQGLKQLYVLVFGLDVLGNPYGLVVGITKGVEDLFYEPFQGAIQGPGEFVQGLALGVKSLFGHTVGGAAGAVSKITGAMGKGIAALTFDKEYQRKRREALNKKPANFQEQIARSGKGLVMGVVDGVTGVFTKPISGAKEEGVGGFFKGLGKGAIGLVARPTAGVVDFASGSLGAVKRCTETLEEVQRVRPPRFIHPDNVLKPYAYYEAHGNKMLKEIDKGKYAHTDEFKHCEEVQKSGELVIVTNHRVMYATKNDLFGTWSIQWTYRWPEIFSIKSTENSVIVVIKGNTKKGLFTSSEPIQKLIEPKHKARIALLTELMSSLKSLDGE